MNTFLTLKKAFTVTSIWNSKSEQDVTGIDFPLRDVEKVTAYFSNCDRITPAMICIYHGVKESGDRRDSKWLNNEDNNRKLADVGKDPQFNPTDTIKQLTSNIRLCLGYLDLVM